VDRYQPTEPDPANNPVVLCHGLSYNNRFWDLTSENSLARFRAVKTKGNVEDFIADLRQTDYQIDRSWEKEEVRAGQVR